MKQFLFLLLVCCVGFLFSCKSESSNSNTSVSDVASEQDIQAMFDGAVGQSVDSQLTIPKYQVLKGKTKDPKAQLEVLETVIPSTCKLPTKIGDLNGGTDFNIYKFDHNASATASAYGFTGEIGKKQMLFIQDFIRHDFIECNGKKTKVGIGLRCFIHVTNFKSKLAFSSLPNLAANVQLEKANCTFSLKALGFGIDGTQLAEGLQTQGDYNVENFGKLSVLFNTLLKTLNSDSKMKIKPVELPN